MLVDFEGGYKKQLGGKSIEQEIDNQGKDYACNKYLNAGVDFWTKLEWIEGGKELFQCASSLFNKVCILSSAGSFDPARCQMVKEGKMIWLKNNIPSIPINNIFIVDGKDVKQNYSTPTSILIDDLTSTIKQWNNKGGFGILHNHKNYKKSIEELKDIITPMKLSEIIKRVL